MSQYMLLIYQPTENGPSEAEQAARYPQWIEFTQSLHDAGVFVAGDRLHDPGAATTVRVRGGETQVTDGPFADTKEFLAGYYLVDCPDLDSALALAERIPNVDYASIEVRPIVAMRTPV